MNSNSQNYLPLIVGRPPLYAGVCFAALQRKIPPLFQNLFNDSAHIAAGDVQHGTELVCRAEIRFADSKDDLVHIVWNKVDYVNFLLCFLLLDVGKNGLEGVDEMTELMRKRKKCVNIF